MFLKPKRPVSRVFVHCSASDAAGPAYQGAGLVKTIDAWHKARTPPFRCIGYHFVIDKDGVVSKGRDIESIPAAQIGNNSGTIAVCCHGLDEKKFTAVQLAALKSLCAEINKAYNGSVTFHGHREVEKNKTCPVFDYRKVLGLDKFGRVCLNKTMGDIMKLFKLPVLALVAMLAFSGGAIAQPADAVAPETAVTAPAADNSAGSVTITAEGPTSTVVDFAPVVKSVDSLLYVLVAALAAMLYGLLSKIPFFNKLVTREQYQKLVDPLLDQAVAFGVGKLENADWLKVDTKNAAIAHAVQYVLDHGGDLLKKFGITEQSLREKLEAKLVANGWDTKPGQWSAPEQA